jgi:hypothetical protein
VPAAKVAEAIAEVRAITLSQDQPASRLTRLRPASPTNNANGDEPWPGGSEGPDIGDFENVQIIEVLGQAGDTSGPSRA